ncbi:MAG: hypothetical protein AB2L24_18945 [Mangrovibacterium sp.]
MKKYFIILLVNIFSVFICSGQPEYKSITWEKFQASSPGLKQTGWIETKHSRDIDSSPWSVGCETLDRDYADFSIYKNYVGELGVKHARLQSGWAKTEKQKGIYNFEWLDSCVYGLVEQGVAPWISLSYGNPLYKSQTNLGAGIFTDEVTLTAWCHYVEAIVSHYKDVVDEWEIWNEPRHSESPEAYANLLIRTSETIRRVQPGAIVMGFTVHGFSPSVVLKFPHAVFEILKAKNKTNVVDYVTYHPYTQNPDGCYSMVEGLEKLVHSYNPKIKLYQGESGCPSVLEWGHAMNNYPWTEYSQAKWDLRRMAGDWARGIRSSVFTVIDLRYTSMLQSFGLIRSNLKHEIIYKRPSYYGVQHMVSFFDDTAEPTGILKYESNSPRSMTVAGFKKQESPVLLVWQDDQVPTDELKWDAIGLTIKGIKFKDPVYVEMITGKIYEIESQCWTNGKDGVEFINLPVWDSPVMIAERVAVNNK